MKAKKTLKTVSLGVSALFAGLLTISIGASSLVNTYRSWIDSNLKTQSSGMVNGNYNGDIKDLYNFQVKSEEETGYDLTTTKGMYDYQKAAAIEIASEGIVLMKNKDDAALPLAKNSNVTLLGTTAYNVWHGGMMASMPVASEKIGFVDALKDEGFSVNQKFEEAYKTAPGYGEKTTTNAWGGSSTSSNLATLNSGVFDLKESTPEDLGLTADDADKSSTAIIVVGRPAGENSYYLPGAAGKTEGFGENDALGLSTKELETIKYAKDNFSKVVVIVNSDSAMDIPELFEKDGQYEADAVLWAGLPGTYGWVAVAQVLDGTVNPSGGMVDTYAAKSSVSAANQNYGVFTFANKAEMDAMEAGTKYQNDWYMPEAEGIYIGYRYYETRYYDAVMNPTSHASDPNVGTDGKNLDTADPEATTWNYDDEVVTSFGYGLSYTTFTETLKSVTVDEANKKVTATVEVKNEGDVAGKHAVELYVSSPYAEGEVEKSAIQLIGYDKTDLIEPDKTDTVTITADFQDFASYDSKLEHDGVTGGYVLDAGNYYFAVGNGAHDALNNVLDAQGKTPDNSVMDYEGDGAKASVKNFKELTLTESKNGETIENQLQNMELSNFDEEITELSRTDWTGTWPETYDSLSYTEAMEPGLLNHLNDIKQSDNGGKEVIWGANNGATFASIKPEKGETVAYDDPELLKVVQNVTLQEALNSVTQCGGQDWDAIPSISQPAFKTTDGPVGYDEARGALKTDWNTANTLYDCADDDYYGNIQMRPLPTEPVIGATFSHEMAAKSGEVLSMIALWAGVAEVWGPGVNIHRTPYNARNHEYYSEDPIHLSWMAEDFANEAQQNGLITCLKHFAFNDTEMNRDGIAPFMSEQRARELDLRAFQRAIESGHATSIMTAFNRAGEIFTGAHKGLMTNILREEWGFQGFAVTDMIGSPNYVNPRDSLVAGTNGMLIASSANFINGNMNGWAEFTVEGLAEDMDMQQALQDSVHHALWKFINSNVTNGWTRDAKIRSITTWYDQLLTGIISATAVITAIALASYVTLTVIECKSKEDEEVA